MRQCLEIDPAARFSPDGRRLAAIDSGHLVVVDVAAGTKTRLTATSDQSPYGFAESPVSAPDGTRIAYGWFVNKRWELRVVPAAGGAPQVLFNKTNFFYPTDWSPDGQQVLGWVDRPDGKSSIAMVSMNGGLTELRTWEKTKIPGTSSAGMGTFSPDGRDVAYGKNIGNTSKLFVLNVATGSETALTSGPVSERLPVWSPDGHVLLFL